MYVNVCVNLVSGLSQSPAPPHTWRGATAWGLLAWPAHGHRWRQLAPPALERKSKAVLVRLLSVFCFGCNYFHIDLNSLIKSDLKSKIIWKIILKISILMEEFIQANRWGQVPTHTIVWPQLLVFPGTAHLNGRHPGVQTQDPHAFILRWCQSLDTCSQCAF